MENEVLYLSNVDIASRGFQAEDRGMEIPETVQCPFCGQSFEVVIDTSVSPQRLTSDCEVCCRPLEISVECEPGEVLSLEVR